MLKNYRLFLSTFALLFIRIVKGQNYYDDNDAGKKQDQQQPTPVITSPIIEGNAPISPPFYTYQNRGSPPQYGGGMPPPQYMQPDNTYTGYQTPYQPDNGAGRQNGFIRRGRGRYNSRGRGLGMFKKTPFGATRQDFQQFSEEECSVDIVETIPVGMNYTEGDKYLSTKDVWLDMINSATTKIDIVAFYWTLTTIEDRYGGKWNTTFAGMEEGKKVYDALITAKRERNVQINILQNAPGGSHSCEDSFNLARENVAEVRNLNMARLAGSGVVHSKFIIIDDRDFYLGSANMDWRALSDVKELGLRIANCTNLAMDLQNIFQVYWYLSSPDSVIPNSWLPQFGGHFSVYTPMKLGFPDGSSAFVFISHSPPKLCPPGRTNDLLAIKHVMRAAKRFVYISVMSYRPFRMYIRPERYWASLDTVIRATAIERRLEVRIMIARWKNFKDSQLHFMQSLMALTNVYRGVKITAKEFIVPADDNQKRIPFARVNHNKFMVTDNAAYIGTSNWIGNYFIDTTGVGMVMEGDTKIRQDLEDLYNRDWSSEYAIPIEFAHISHINETATTADYIF